MMTNSETHKMTMTQQRVKYSKETFNETMTK